MRTSCLGRNLEFSAAQCSLMQCLRDRDCYSNPALLLYMICFPLALSWQPALTCSTQVVVIHLFNSPIQRSVADAMSNFLTDGMV